MPERGSDTHEDMRSFIANCVRQGKIYWTYHSNMRLEGRLVDRENLLAGLMSANVIKVYSDDSPLPTCLCLIYTASRDPIHAVVAMDREDRHIRIVTVYRPDPDLWDATWTRRRKP